MRVFFILLTRFRTCLYLFQSHSFFGFHTYITKSISDPDCFPLCYVPTVVRSNTNVTTDHSWLIAKFLINFMPWNKEMRFHAIRCALLRYVPDWWTSGDAISDDLTTRSDKMYYVSIGLSSFSWRLSLDPLRLSRLWIPIWTIFYV
jgi:hypothetical protein